MALLLNHSLPNVPDEYDPDDFTRIMRDIEIALTKLDFPVRVSGKDDTNGIAWFME